MKATGNLKYFLRPQQLVGQGFQGIRTGMTTAFFITGPARAYR
jgi:hypothetical protein